MNKQAIDKLIFALDVKSYEEALSWIELLSEHVGMFKVGKELFTSVGPKIIEVIKKKGSKVFLDLKYHDIPNTVARAAEAAVGLNVDMFSVHASGGSKMIKETVVAANNRAEQLKITKPDILAVTVLTSLDDHDMKDMGFSKQIKDMVIDLARIAILAGATGIVASPQDILALRSNLGEKFVIITPGIRTVEKTEKTDDQKRISDAYEAVKVGADYIVVGRPIRSAENPLEICCQITEKIAEGLAAR